MCCKKKGIVYCLDNVLVWLQLVIWLVCIETFHCYGFISDLTGVIFHFSEYKTKNVLFANKQLSQVCSLVILNKLQKSIYRVCQKSESFSRVYNYYKFFWNGTIFYDIKVSIFIGKYFWCFKIFSWKWKMHYELAISNYVILYLNIFIVSSLIKYHCKFTLNVKFFFHLVLWSFLN